MKKFKNYWFIPIVLIFISLIVYIQFEITTQADEGQGIEAAATVQVYLPAIEGSAASSMEATVTPPAAEPTMAATATPLAVLPGAIVYTDGDIYTMNPDQPWAEAVLVHEGRILAVGSQQEVLASAGESPTVIAMGGRMMMPGFQDAHMHALEAGLNETLCVVSREATAAQYLTEIQECADQQGDAPWVRASGANMAAMMAWDQLPINILDEAVPDRPALVLDDLGHGAWLNTLAMEAVGYDTLETDPPGGLILFDPDSDDALMGIVLENAQQKARTASIPPTEANLELAYQSLLLSFDNLAENGVTSISDAGGYWTRAHETVWQRAVAEGTISVRASNALYVYPDQPFDAQIAELKARYSNEPEQLLRFNQAKIYVDGILSQGTGALLTPYDADFGFPNVPNDGFLYFDVATLNRYATELSEAGFQLHFHVTGDRGARLALDAIEAVGNGATDPRHRLTHLYLIDNADRTRFDALGVVADFQLSPDAVSQEYVEIMTPFLGDRVDSLLPAFDLLDIGAKVTLSSDWDADVLSPFNKIASVLGQQAENRPELSVVLRMMTLDVAYLLHQEDTTGSIEVGKWADLIVLDQNLFDVDESEIGNTQVLMTLLAGEQVYSYGEANTP